MRVLCDALGHQVLLADAGTEDRLGAVAVDVARDLFGAEGCVAVLSLTRARLVRSLHEEQLRAGADLVRTNTSQASPLELRRYGLEDDAFAINLAAAQLASAAVDAVPGDGRRRFVLGVVRDLGWDASPQEIEEAVAVQASALIAGGVDGVALEVAAGTCRGPAFLNGARRAKQEATSAASTFVFQTGGETPEVLRKLADGVICYREVAVKDAAEFADALRAANLIGGSRAEDTASLDQRLRALAEETVRPPIAAARRTDGTPSPVGVPAPKRRASSPAQHRSAPAGTVIHCASRWRHRL